MSYYKTYSELEDNEKLVNSTHLAGKIGETLRRLLLSIQHQFEEINHVMNDVLLPSSQITNSLSDDVDAIANIFGLVRITGESDIDFRNRVMNHVSTFEATTIDGILNLFAVLTGRRPYISEEFKTRVYHSGDDVDPTSGGKFSVVFELPYSIVHEEVFVNDGGTSVTVNNTIEAPDTSQLNGDVNSTTAIIPYTGLIGDFLLDEGEIKIDNEFIRYGSINTSSNQFEGCIRGMYDSVPASHLDGATITEATNNAWTTGSDASIYDHFSGNTIFLSGGPYDAGTVIRVRYETSVDESLSDLVDMIDQLKNVGYAYSAAGVRTDFSIGKLLSAFQSETMESLTIVDNELFDFVIIGFSPSESISMPTFDGTYMESSDWDRSVWDITTWDTPPSITDDYYLELSIN